MKFKTIALCTTLAIMTLTACGSEPERGLSRKDRREIQRQLDEIEKNNKKIEFMLCQLKLLDRVDLRAPDASAQMDAITDNDNIENVKRACGLE